MKIYVLMESGVYVYNSSDHSLELYKRGDFRWIGQYDTAETKLGMIWDKSLSKNESTVAGERGMIGQNVYLMANALGLGTVTTAQKTYELYLLGLPLHEQPLVIIPLGYPMDEYDFSYAPFNTVLPFPETNTMCYVDTLINEETCAFLSSSLSD